MKYLLDRLKEDNTKQALGQLCLLVVFVAMMLGVDVNSLLTQAEATSSRVVALLAVMGGVGVQLHRILTPAPSATIAAAAVNEIATAVSDKVSDNISK